MARRVARAFGWPALVTADKWGLVTVPAAVVNKGRNRIVITKP